MKKISMVVMVLSMTVLMGARGCGFQVEDFIAFDEEGNPVAVDPGVVPFGGKCHAMADDVHFTDEDRHHRTEKIDFVYCCEGDETCAIDVGDGSNVEVGNKCAFFAKTVSCLWPGTNDTVTFYYQIQ